jgi:pentatricopeptide repeat protein
MKSHHRYLGEHHYELLFDAHVNKGSIEDAIELLCEMELDGFRPDHASTRPLLLWFMEHTEVNPAVFFEQLVKINQEGRKTPVAALNVLIEACVKQHGERAEAAFRMYDWVRTAVPTGPDIVTFHHMFELSRITKSLDWALKLAFEHKEMGFEPNAMIYDGLIMACLDGGYDIEKILNFYHDMVIQGIVPLKRTMRALYRALRVAKHYEARRILEDIAKRTVDEDQIVRLVKRTDTVVSKIERGEEVQAWEDGRVMGLLPPAAPDVAGTEMAIMMEDIQEQLAIGGELESQTVVKPSSPLKT